MNNDHDIERTKLLERIDNDFTYHPPFGTQVERYHAVRGAGRKLAEAIVVTVPPSRELSIALGKIEEAIFYANAAIARNEKVEDTPTVRARYVEPDEDLEEANKIPKNAFNTWPDSVEFKEPRAPTLSGENDDTAGFNINDVIRKRREDLADKQKDAEHREQRLNMLKEAAGALGDIADTTRDFIVWTANDTGGTVFAAVSPAKAADMLHNLLESDEDIKDAFARKALEKPSTSWPN